MLPSGLRSTIAGIDTYDGPVEEAFPPMSVTIRLTDDVDVSRGDMICRPGNQPEIGQDIDAMVCWMADKPLAAGGRYGLKHTTRSVRAVVRDLRYRLDVNTLHRDETAGDLGLNEIGRVTLRTTAPLMYDDYHRNRTTGSFILIDEATNATVGAGHDPRPPLVGRPIGSAQLAAELSAGHSIWRSSSATLTSSRGLRCVSSYAAPARTNHRSCRRRRVGGADLVDVVAGVEVELGPRLVVRRR